MYPDKLLKKTHSLLSRSFSVDQTHLNIFVAFFPECSVSSSIVLEAAQQLLFELVHDFDEKDNCEKDKHANMKCTHLLIILVNMRVRDTHINFSHSLFVHKWHKTSQVRARRG